MSEIVIQQEEKEADPRLRPFDRFEKDGRYPNWLLPLRKAGIAQFSEYGFPTTKDEDWRFTPIKPITNLPFSPTFDRPSPALTKNDLNRLAFSKLGGPKLVFVDGHFVGELSDLGAPVDGVIVTNLASALKDAHPALQEYLGQQSTKDRNTFAALNMAYFLDGAFIHLKPKAAMDDPIQLLHISTTQESGITNHIRNLVVVEANARAVVIESQVSLGGSTYFNNVVNEFVVGKNASLEHVKFQDEATDAYHLAGIYADLDRDSRFWSHSIALGAALSRNNIRTRLAGEGLECVLNGLYLTRDEQLADHHMVVDHAAPNCASHEYFNGILDDRSRSVFHGRILVRQPAQKTDAKQTNKNLLLSDEATANTKPQLEIYADDVKCTHGATVGQLDEDAIFYLRARGVPTDIARQMLMHAFAGEIIDRIQCGSVREELDQLVWDRLEENPQIAHHE